jgi:hypothetical protein
MIISLIGSQGLDIVLSVLCDGGSFVLCASLVSISHIFSLPNVFMTAGFAPVLSMA